MFDTPTSIPEPERKAIIDALDDVLEDGLALQLLLYFAHWNVKGPSFAALHPFFGTLADSISATNDRVAERIVILGGTAKVELSEVATGKSVKEADLVGVVSTGAKQYLECLESARDGMKDEDTEQLLTDAVLEWTKYGWQLLATLGR